jgi:hypothetical protein
MNLQNRLFLASDNCNNEEAAGIGLKLQVLLFFVCAALIVTRRPDALSNPQFFGEDGSIWFPEAYMYGWFSALLHSKNGYFQTLPRLAAGIALLVPFRFAPLMENLMGLTIQVLPINYLLSARCRSWAPLFTRILMAALYLGLPNSRELNVAIEEGQWHLALLACILALACPPRNRRWQIADISILLLSGLSGPFSVILFPLTLILWWFRRERWRLIASSVVGVAAIIQVSALLAHAEATRSHAILGATPQLFIELLAKQVYLGAMLGKDRAQIQAGSLVLAAVALGGTVIIAYCLLKARLEWKLLVAFCLLVFAVSLRSPMVSMTVPQWELLRDSPGIRYWFFPLVGFLWSLAWCASLASNGVVRFAGAAGLIMTCTGIITDWRHPAYTDFHFQASAAKFAAAAPGTMVNIPIFPAPWTMRLVKRSPACHGLLIASVDQPLPGAKIFGTVPVTGWVVGSEGVRRISVYVDRAFVQSVAPNGLRTDVDSLYPQARDRYKGWGTLVDMSKFVPGQHEIEVRALDAKGCEADIAVIPAEIAGTAQAAARVAAQKQP